MLLSLCFCSLSLGGGRDPALNLAVENAYDNGAHVFHCTDLIFLMVYTLLSIIARATKLVQFVQQLPGF